MAAVAKELKKRGLSDAKVFLAVGLPLTRFGADGTGRYYNQNCNDRRRKPVEITGQHAEDRQ